MADDAQWVLAALYRYETPLLRFAASIAGRAHAADVVQETFLRLCNEPREKVEGHLAAWLFTVCKNRAIELRRSDRRMSSMEEVDVEPSPDSGPMHKLERKQAATQVERAVATLSDKHRQVLLLKIDGGLSYKEIAEVMNLSVSNVGFILHSAISEIRAVLGSQEQPAAVGRSS